MQNSEAVPAGAAPKNQLVRAIVAGTVGTTIEWYDFFLYNTAAALVFAKLFFPKADPTTGILAAFAIQFVGFAARPIGAFVFGHFGDRVGRKKTLIVTLLMMGLASAAIGLLPTYAQIGVTGAVLLTILRLLQGIAVGGEWGGSVLLAMEWGHRGRRGWVASWPQWGVPAGLVLGNGAFLVLNATLSESAFQSWGWRVPFLLSLVLVAVGLYIRLGILETPLFTKIIEERKVESAPSLRVLVQQPREIILSALIRVSEQAPFYLFTAFVLTYVTTTLKLTRGFALNGVLLAALVSLVSIPLFGYLSDVIGRKRMYLIGVVATGLFAFPYFWMLNSKVGAFVLLAIVLSLIPHDMQYGPQAALIAENFTGRLRYSGASIGYQLASIVAGGPAPLIAVALLATYKSYVPIALYMVACSAISLVALILMPDRSKVDISEEFATGERRGPAPRVIAG
ncbi:MAG: MHS family MFS transporter [Candidatus Dormibacteraeota bacterium]|nr:MHS family MFS transporter [Candidatus Dormibacteraeota bacterium]